MCCSGSEHRTLLVKGPDDRKRKWDSRGERWNVKNIIHNWKHNEKIYKCSVQRDTLPGLTELVLLSTTTLYLYCFVGGSLSPCAGYVSATVDRSPTEGLMSAFMKRERCVAACGSPLGRGLA